MNEDSSMMDYDRLAELNSKMKFGSSNKKEKDELVQILKNSGSLSEKQYSNYRSGRNAEDIFEAALVIGGIVLLGKLIDKLVS